MKIYSTFDVVYEKFYKNNVDKKDIKKISKAWEKCFKTVLKNKFGFNKKARKVCFKWGEYGFNWKALHAEEDKDFQYYRDEFFSEVQYNSDRMDFNRLLRCHHLFQLMVNKAKEKQNAI